MYNQIDEKGIEQALANAALHRRRAARAEQRPSMIRMMAETFVFWSIFAHFAIMVLRSI